MDATHKSIPDLQCTPGAPAPSWAGLMRPQLHIHKIRAERDDKGRNECERVSSFFYGNHLRETVQTLVFGQ